MLNAKSSKMYSLFNRFFLVPALLILMLGIVSTTAHAEGKDTLASTGVSNKDYFTDVNEATAHKADIYWLAETGVSEGWKHDDGTAEFRPYADIARCDMAAFLFRLARGWGIVDDTWQPTGSNSFTDVTGETYHHREVMWLAESGISEGWKHDDGTAEFRPYASIARADMAAFIARLYRLNGGITKGAGEFTDADGDTSHVEDIVWLASAGISEGWKHDDGTAEFRPYGNVARADMAAFLHRLDGAVSSELPREAGEISFRRPSNDHIVFDDESGGYFVDNEILITGRENATREEIERIIGGFNGVIVGYIEITNDYQVEVSKAMTIYELQGIIDQLNENEAIEQAMIHNIYEMEFDAVPNDSKWSSEEWSSDYPEGINWGVEAINAMGAWEHYDQMSNVRVGIIDSMFDTNHEDLEYKKVWNNPQSINSESLDYFKRSHGTHVSGTLAAIYNNNKGIAGVAPKVSLYGYSILGSSTDSVETDSNKAFSGFMQWKYALANLITSNCKVINVSMSNDSDLNWQRDVLGTFLNKLITNGYEFVIVQAAGNASSDATVSGLFTGITIPAVRNRIIVVGAIENRGSHKNGLFGWLGDRVFDGYKIWKDSNFGDRVDVVAPGVKIYSTVPNNGYEDSILLGLVPWDGTSMAAPHVSGIAAMCFSSSPSLTGAQVKSIITNSATTPVTDTNTGHPRRVYRVANARAAVESALTTPGEAVSPVNPSTGIVMGTVMGYLVNLQTTRELSDVSVSAYRVSDYDGNLSEYASSTQSDANGNFELVLEAGKYYINIYEDGYLPFAIRDVIVTNDQITYLDNVKLVPAAYAEKSSYVQGTIRNALTGISIEGVTVQLRSGWNNKNGDLATAPTGSDAVSQTDGNGQYSLEMMPGCYTAELIKEGFITGYANVICVNNGQGQDAVITPVLSDDEYRIVLTWSSTPDDLDSHISGPLSTGGRFHVYYSRMSASDNGETVAELDLDDTSSYGPETITLTKTQDGVYKYAVHDYTNRGNTSSTALSMSGAKVELYSGNSLIGTYNVPINVTGTVWNVFEIEGNTIRMINTMENSSNPDAVCAVSNSSESDVAVIINSDELRHKEIDSTNKNVVVDSIV